MKSKDWPELLITAVCGIVKDRRLALNLTVYALSQKSGVSQQAISYYEKGTRRPTLEGLAKVASGLGMELSELIASAERKIRE